MKSHLLFILLTLILSALDASAQNTAFCTGNCLTVGAFTNACSSPTDPSCPTWSGSCTGWYVSNGTPQEFPNSSSDFGNYKTPCNNNYFMSMWSQYSSQTPIGVIGEGIYTDYSFTNGQSYDIRIAFTATVTGGLPAGETDGTIYIYAANGLSPYSGTYCGSAPPFTNKYLLKSYSITNSTTNIDQVFTVSIPGTAGQVTYNQLWIYPEAISPVGQVVPMVNLGLSSIFVCPSPGCPSATVYYNSGTLPASVSQGTIFIGSTAGSGGSGIVTAATGSATSVVAGNLIGITPNFSYKATTSGSLTFSITPCYSLYNMVASIPDSYDSINVANASINESIAKQDSIQGLAIRPQAIGASLIGITSSDSTISRLMIYPTISAGTFTITGSPTDLNNANIVVADESGRIVYNTYNAASTTIPLDLDNLSNGLYFVQIRQQTKVTTQKIIISK